MGEHTNRHHGLWHLAKEPQKTAPGTMQVQEGGRLVVELSGVLGADESELPPGQHRLVGQLDDLSTVLLERCYVTRGPLPFSRTPTQTWVAGEALFGVQCDPDEPLTLSGADFEIAGLTKWTRWTAFDLRAAMDMAARMPVQALWTDDGVIVDLVQRVRMSMTSEVTATVESPVVLRARGSALPPQKLHDIATRPVLALLALATGKCAAISRKDAFVPMAEGEGRSPPLRWLAQPLQGNLDAMRDSFGFLYKDLSGLAPDALQNAYELLKRVHLVVDLYLASLRDTGYAEVGFNLVAQSLETYHRTRESSSPLPAPLWDELRKDLKATVEKHQNENATTQEIKDAYALLSANLDFINQTSFRNRLRQLIEGVRLHADAICGGDIDRFLASVVQTRNFYVHWHDKPGRMVVRGAEAVELKSRMLALLEITLLQDLGFPAGSDSHKNVLRRRVSWLPVT
jgi:hypothetical protein